MSFRDNLQHLRAARNMTQEQLAMLLGVSRQTVTKWEAEKSNPEMDKLIDMCRIFLRLHAPRFGKLRQQLTQTVARGQILR